MTLRKWEDIGNWKRKQYDHTLWKTCFGRDYGPVVKQTTKWMSDWIVYSTYVILVGP